MGNLDAVILSPPYAANAKSDRTLDRRRKRNAALTGKRQGDGCFTTSEAYGTHPGQLGALKAGEPPVTTTASGVPVQTWAGCYDSSWKDILFPKAFAHPAKMARGLLERILGFGLAEGFWDKDSILGDCFGGVGTTGILCSYRGIQSVSVELEPRFYGLSMATRRLHRHKLERLGCPLPVYLRGDSRHFAALVGQCGAVVTSPPWQESLGSQDKKFRAEGLGQGAGRWAQNRSPESVARLTADYGTTPGNLGNLPAGTLDGAITSPPYATGDTAGPESLARRTDEAAARMLAAQRWGTGGQTTDGNLANLPAGALDGAVTSPGYGGSEMIDNRKTINQTINGVGLKDGKHRGGSLANVVGSYADPGNVSVQAGQTYWQAVAAIYAQVRLALKPGGVLAVVVKSFVKGKAIVDLPGQTAQLLTRLGFTVFLEVHALLTKETTHPGLFDAITEKKSRKSFFRRLCESKGAPPIDHETVLFARKE